MADLIDRQTALKAIGDLSTNMSVCLTKEACYGMMQMKDVVLAMLNNLPAAQPDHKMGETEIIRCKDCIHLEVLNGDRYYARCQWHGRLFDSFGKVDIHTWFCADGERMTDDD